LNGRGGVRVRLLRAGADPPRRFGVAELRDGRIVRLIEKPKEPPSNLAIVGVYLFDRHIFEAIQSIKPSARGELELTDAVQTLIERGHRVKPYLLKGWWKDVGLPEDMLDANRLLLETLEPRLESPVPEDSKVIGRVAIGPNVKIERSELRGPLVIGPGAVIRDSFVGPFTALDRGVVIEGSEIEYSIVMAGATIRGTGRIDHSLIGRNVVIRRNERPPEAYQFVIGDNSRVQLI